MAEIAEGEKLTTVEVAVQVARNGGAAIVNFSMSEEDVRHIMQVKWVATASDGRAYLPGADPPHPRSYGTFAPGKWDTTPSGKRSWAFPLRYAA
ncbi:MAG: hypothetical protein CM1200mP2_54960 [Planctomycetaceae bacterium]|nr:MAG: hypothetical protein CM1200mP2_54960 [Planctomycetaceae bacterium]